MGCKLLGKTIFISESLVANSRFGRFGSIHSGSEIQETLQHWPMNPQAEQAFAAAEIFKATVMLNPHLCRTWQIAHTSSMELGT